MINRIKNLTIEINGDVNIYIYSNGIPKKLSKEQVYSILNQLISVKNNKPKTENDVNQSM